MKFFLFISLFLIGCTTQSKCNRLFPPSEKHFTTTIIRQRDSLLPGAIIEKQTPVYIPGEKESKIIRFSDTSGLAELRFYYNEQLKNWVAVCEAKERKFTFTDSLITTLIERVKEKEVVKYKTPFYIWLIIGGLVLFAFRSKIWSLLKIFIF